MHADHRTLRLVNSGFFSGSYVHFLSLCTLTIVRGALLAAAFKGLGPIHTKRKQKQKFSLMFAAYTSVFSDGSLIFFAFARCK